MYFVFALLLALGATVTVQGYRYGKKMNRMLGTVLLIAAAGTGLVTYLALSVIGN